MKILVDICVVIVGSVACMFACNRPNPLFDATAGHDGGAGASAGADGGAGTSELDGSTSSAEGDTDPTPGSQDTTLIGAAQTDPSIWHFDGRIDELRVTSARLSAAGSGRSTDPRPTP